MASEALRSSLEVSWQVFRSALYHCHVGDGSCAACSACWNQQVVALVIASNAIKLAARKAALKIVCMVYGFVPFASNSFVSARWLLAGGCFDDLLDLSFLLNRNGIAAQ